MAKDPIRGVPKARAAVPMKPPSGAAVKLVKKATERLEEDAREMEDRLAQLRLSMLEEKKKRDAELPAKHGGNRWRSAREDRGSVSKYALDVQNKARVASSNGVAGSTSAGAKKKAKRKKAPSADDARASLGIISVATVATWTPAQVLEWLSTIGLEEYQSSFEYHQVTGATLLELTLSEYTQMGITKLSARNVLYTEIEKIRDKAGAAADESSSCAQDRRNPPTEIVDSKLRDVQPEVGSSATKRSSGGAVHWSQLKPLADTSVANGNGDVPVNLADGEFDEDASHASFMKALLEWRSCDNRDAQEQVGGSGATDKDELWVNPMLSLFGDNDNSNETEQTLPRGGALLDGSYDEEKEQEAFRRAVDAWRNGASATIDNSRSVEQIEQGCPAVQRKSCWQCYQVVHADALVLDEQTKKQFCSAACRSSYCQEYARFYVKH